MIRKWQEITSGPVQVARAHGRRIARLERNSASGTTVIERVSSGGGGGGGGGASGAVLETDPDWIDLTDGGTTALHSHSGGTGKPIVFHWALGG